MTKNILVTGAGALLGQGILRLLQISDFSKKIFTADPDIRSTGHWLGDYAITIPKATEENYISTIKKIVVEHKIDAILVGTDVELPILSQYKNEFLKDFNCKIIVSNKEVIDISNDKFLTAKFLEKNNFPFPFSVMANDKEKLSLIEKKLGFPLFAKPYDGARSLGILKIDNHEQLLSIYCENSNLVVQQFLPETDGEFTSGCVVIGGKCKAIVTLKRDLRDGNTYRAYVDKDTSKYDSYIIAIAEKLNADGPVNFQFRIVDDKPIVFEINGRFSGTTPIRHFFGFNEVEAILKYELFGIEIEKTALKNGIVLRAWSDIFIEENEFNSFKSNSSLENPNAEFYDFNLKK
ncbi:ATP-grasp domain-containing protein [Flavobacterium psychrophilum]|uniref:Probable carbamoyl-phosphate synthase n=1 Tax=Flavobacterium psychrophilum (strain ATCC 49511 / DSM 21280 / CIP 103535 / JIP02/86) TaxID=402612 RepID=A6GZ42_FLAPJ|nr:ATP-grasp domain-containing protein [Flavobacterium psychrophilum]EKT4544161.1 ATP-grasp domain-containing protein [Flavobacterium psychrophilum]ELY2009311.1 ATP-grasp domain-containing protein [Flavobacterium psychrophilum]MCB5980711.1 ATP-grasp domain-containing protein [Flavobacterium psychrophilum]MCB5984600.1 ATP-grasp domain-containing protein [Flavobacterium psychrophilum]MCB5985862.1 ATP-grasp domain-containing protein [Flavobacterium psychrophilum]